MSPQEIARKWLDVASQGTVNGPYTIFRFIAVWIAFNAIYASQFQTSCTGRSTETSLRNTPAMAASITDYLQTIEELLNAGTSA